MTEVRHITAPSDTWTAAVYAAKDSRLSLLGTGVVIDEYRVLTCAHVVKRAGRANEALYVNFPKAGVGRQPIVVAAVRLAEASDVAVLRLAEPAPRKVTPATLRTPEPAALTNEPWWSFGLAKDAPYGASAHGRIGDSLAWGWMALLTESRDQVREGFSGAGIWCERHQAVVGLIGQAVEGGPQAGDAVGISMYQIAHDLPDEKIDRLAAWVLPNAGEEAIAAWGWTWSLGKDEEARRHWKPRARGVSVDSEPGHRFRGRVAALTEIVSWLDRQSPDRRVLVVTGSPGVGKSAVLGRVVTTADAEVRASLPAKDKNVKAGIGSVACAIHTKGKSAVDVAQELARAASVGMPREIDDLVPALREVLLRRGKPRFNVVVDALDEATTPTQVRDILSRILLPLVQTCSDVGAQVVIGTRRSDDGGDLIRAVGAAARVINLDEAAYFASDDLAAYAQATLQLVGDARHGNPYEPDHVAEPVARRIAELAGGNFLIAGLVARTHGMYDATPVDFRQLEFTPTVDAALAGYLDRLAPVGRTPADIVFVALAYAQAFGLPTDIWSIALEALGAQVSQSDLAQFVGSAAANFLVESTGDGHTRRYRLFHQALNDALLRRQDFRGGRQAGEFAITRRLISYGRQHRWSNVDKYLYQALPVHAERVDLIDELLNDNDYLLHADLRRLTSLADRALTEAGQARGKLLRLTPLAISATAAERAALLGMTQTMEGLGDQLTFSHPGPYKARWAKVSQRTERIVLEGHGSRVNALCAIVVDNRTLLASASDDWTVRLWEANTGTLDNTMRGHEREVTLMCSVSSMTRTKRHTLLVTSGPDRTVRVWDPASASEVLSIGGSASPHKGFRVHCMCSAGRDGDPVVALGCDDGIVRLWHLGENRLEEMDVGAHRRNAAIETHRVTSLASYSTHEGTALVVGSGTVVTVHDLALGKVMQKARLTDEVTALAVAVVKETTMETRSGRSVEKSYYVTYIICASAAGALQSFPHRNDGGATWPILRNILGEHERTYLDSEGSADRSITNGITSIAPITSGDHVTLAIARERGPLQLKGWAKDAIEGSLENEAGVACPITLGPRTFVAVAARDGAIRLWDPTTMRQGSLGDEQSSQALCRIPVKGGGEVIAGVYRKAVRLWTASEGRMLTTLAGNAHNITGLCLVNAAGTQLLAASTLNSTVEIWDLATQRRRYPLSGHSAAYTGICSLITKQGPLLAVSSSDRTVWVWEPEQKRSLFGAKHKRLRRLAGHTGQVTAICTIAMGGNVFAASTGADDTIRIWDPSSEYAVKIIKTNGHRPMSVAAAVIDDRPILITGGDDHTIRIWDPGSGRQLRRLTGHSSTVWATSLVRIGDQAKIASASEDATIRIWSLARGTSELTIPVYHPARACLALTDSSLAIGLSVGIVAIEFPGVAGAPASMDPPALGQ